VRFPSVLRWRAWAARLYRGRLRWPVRLASWALLGAAAWFVSPWLVLPAIVAAEAVWILALRWSWRRDQVRSTNAPPSG
jgi:hypothetical protein